MSRPRDPSLPRQPYASAAAMRAALKDKLTALAAANPSRQLPQLQRQFACLAGYPTLSAAVALVRTFLDPILTGRSAGTWNPGGLVWEEAASDG